MSINENSNRKIFPLPLVYLANAKMHALSMQGTLEIISRRIEENKFTQHTVINVAKFVNMQSDLSLQKAVNACDIINIDGTGLLWGARLLGNDIPERVAGIDLFQELLELSEEQEYPVFFLGAKESVLLEMHLKIKEKHPNLKIADHNHGYFWDNEQEVVDKIRNSGAYLLFVAISSPKKEIFINQWKDKLGVRFVMGVGGSFDVLAGKVKRAPLFMQKIGLEWFYRFLQEPRRMWKRYLVTNIKFVWLLTKSLLSHKTYRNN